MSRKAKSILICAFTIVAYTVYVVQSTGVRAGTDAAINLQAVYSGLQTGHLSTGYRNGQLFELFSTVLWTVLGTSIWQTNWISPLIAILSFTALVAGVSLVPSVRDSKISPVFILGFGVIASPEIFAQFRETSHKALTFTLVMFGVIILLRYKNSSRNRRTYLILLGLFFGAAMLSNYVWTTIALSWIGVILLLTGSIGVALLLLVLDAGIIFYSTGVAVEQVITRGSLVFGTIFSRLLTGVTPSTSASDPSAGSLLANFSTISVFGLEISMFFVYSLGTLTIVLAGGVAFLVAIYDQTTNQRHPLSQFYIAACAVYGILILSSLGGGIAVFAKRMIRPLLLLTLIYWGTALTIPNIYPQKIRNFPLPQRKTLITITLLLLVISIPLGLNRTASDNTGESVDMWTNDTELKSVHFAGQYAGNHDLASESEEIRWSTHKHYDIYVRSKPTDSTDSCIHTTGKHQLCISKYSTDN